MGIHAESFGSHFKMIARSSFIALFALSSVCFAQITVDEDSNDQSSVSPEDVDSRFFNINLGTLDLGNVAGTALGTTLGNLGTGFLQDCFGIGKRSIIMDRSVNRKRRNPQDVSEEVPEVDSRIIGNDEVNSRIFCLNNNNNGGGGYYGGNGGYSNRPNCRTCNCNYDNRCYNTCDKCYQGGYNAGGYSSNSGSNNYGNSGNSGSSVNCRTCWCNDWQCKRSCGKCSSYRDSNTFSQARSEESSDSVNDDAVNFS